MERSNNLVVTLFQEVFALVDRVYTEFNAWSIVIGAFIVYTIFRLVLAPIVGGVVRGAQSDEVKRIRKEYKDNKKGD